MEEGTVGAERPAVIGAHEAVRRPAFRLDEAVAAMGADIVEGPDRAILLADHEDRVTADIVDHEISRLGDLGGPSADVPDPRPDVVQLEFHEFARRVAVACDLCLFGNDPVGPARKDPLAGP